MKIREIVTQLELWAPPSLQESYDNSGLQTGIDSDECIGVMVALDFTEAVLKEAVLRQCNLIIAHHPLIFKPIKSLAGNGLQARLLRFALQHNLALYALHTNLDNVFSGVNRQFAKQIGLVPESLRILVPANQRLLKLQTYVPLAQLEQVRQALFAAGAGSIGNYTECSFSVAGTGTFKPQENTNPFIGKAGGNRELVDEYKLEVIVPEWRMQAVFNALTEAHPYEEVAYEWLNIQNKLQDAGSGLIGLLPEPMQPTQFLKMIADQMGASVIKHSPIPTNPIHRVAICGGAGGFLLEKAISQGAEAYITADLKYHDFFLPDGRILLADIGHAESEMGVIDLICNYIKRIFPTFAVLKSQVDTNPVRYFTGSNG